MLAHYVGNCSRCGTRQVTFDVRSNVIVGERHGWAEVVEIFIVCRACRTSSVLEAERADFTVPVEFGKNDGLANSEKLLNPYLRAVRLVTAKDRFVDKPPEHVAEDIVPIVAEANACLSIECWNAAASMYRLALDSVTKARLPSEHRDDLNTRTRRSLGLRAEWLFDRGLLPPDLRGLADCIREDGNDGAHVGSLTEHDAEDLRDFCNELLRRLYTEPGRVQAAEERRKARRAATTHQEE